MDELNDMRLLAIANQRMLDSDPATWISDEEMNKRFGISEEDLKGFEEVEIE